MTLELISGKGGVGKSTVAAALAIRAAEAGRRPLLAELAGRRTFSRLFGRGVGGEPTEVRPGVSAVALDSKRALEAFVGRRVGLKRLARVRAFQRFAAAAPAAEEVVTLDALAAFAAEGWDPIIVDLDATGHARMFLSLPATFAELPVGGVLRTMLDDFTQVLRSESRLHVVTLPNALPVREARELLTFAATSGAVSLGKIYVSRMPPDLFASDETAADEAVERAVRERMQAESALLPLVDSRVDGTAKSVADGGARQLRLIPDLLSPTPEAVAAALSEAEAFAPVEREVLPMPPLTPTSNTSAFDVLVNDAKLVVMVGTNGVGKTTTAAALALRAADAGRRVALLTIDPAKRLADALGLQTLGDDMCAIEGASGLHASMLDTQSGYDALIRTIASDAAPAIIANPVYRVFSKTFARSHSYVAVERLYELMNDPRFDLVVLDTPPARSALEILDAPATLAAFLDDEVLQPFLAGERAASLTERVARAGGKVALTVLSRIAGGELVDAMVEFFRVLAAQRDGFASRAAANAASLRDESTRLVLVTSAEPLSLADGQGMLQQLEGRRVPPAALIVNRYETGSDAQPDEPGAVPSKDAPFAARLAWLHRRNGFTSFQRRRAVDAFAASTRVLTLAELASDLHSLAGLRTLASTASDLHETA
ncbi:MAG: ArsA-related P-loop ATPase [Myxococcota bacterium]